MPSVSVARRDLCSSGSGCNVQGKVEGHLKVTCQLKKPFKGTRLRKGSCWEKGKSMEFPWQGVMKGPSGKSSIFIHLAPKYLITSCALADGSGGEKRTFSLPIPEG